MRLRRDKGTPATPVMHTESIERFGKLPSSRGVEASPLVSAVLFASGRLVEVSDSNQVFGLVLAGYEGLLFGDDGTFTARVASELPLERWDGVKKLEGYVNEAVQSANPAYFAEHVGFFEAQEAAVYLRAMTKQEHGLFVPDSELSWPNGQLSLSQPSSLMPASSLK